MVKIHHEHGSKKFFILAGIIALYAAFVIYKFGVVDGLTATALTWSFFVLCTPIADAGFLIDFPVRVLFGFKMLYSELLVWGLALTAAVLGVFLAPGVFEHIALLEVFGEILRNPWPLWLIVLLSGIGTFLSIYIGDQIFELVKERAHHHKIKALQWRRLGVELIMFCLILAVYFWLLNLTGITIGE